VLCVLIVYKNLHGTSPNQRKSYTEKQTHIPWLTNLKYNRQVVFGLQILKYKWLFHFRIFFWLQYSVLPSKKKLDDYFSSHLCFFLNLELFYEAAWAVQKFALE